MASQPEQQQHHWRLLTPHKIALLIVLDRDCLSNREEATLAPLLFLLLRHIQKGTGEIDEPTLDDLRDELDQLPLPSAGPSVRESLMTKLAMLNSPDDLFDYVEELAGFLEDADKHDTYEDDESTMKLDPKSVFGAFLRMAVHDFRTSSVDDSMRLYEAFMEYKRRSDSFKRERNSTGALFQTAGSSAYATCAADVSTDSLLTRRDSALFVDHMVNSLEIGSSRVPPPAQLHALLRRVAAEAPEVVNVHYACYLNYVRCGDYESARSSLYQYFEYCSGDVVAAKDFYPCILLNFTTLYATFGYLDLARETIQEAIDVARERRDKKLLVYCLKWSCQLGPSPDNLVGGNRDTIDLALALDVLAARAKENGVALMQSLADLAMVKCALQRAEPPPQLFEPLVRSGSLNFRHGLTGLAGNLHSTCDVVWDTYGSYALSSLHNHLDLQMYRRGKTPEDFAAAYCRLGNKHADQGDFRRALAVIADSEAQMPDNIAARKACARARYELLYDVAAARGEQAAGDLVVSELAALAKIDGESASSLGVWEASQCAQRGRLSEAVSHFRRVIDEQSRPLTALAEVDSMLALIEIHMEAGEPLAALPYVLRCLSLSEMLCSKFCHLLALVRMAEIMLALDLAGTAMDLMEEIMPEIMTLGKVYLEAAGYLTYAKCILACIRPNREELERGNGALSREWRTALRSLEKALSGFSKLQMSRRVQHVLYIQARTYDHLSMRKERNAAAREHRRITAALARARRVVPAGFADTYVDPVVTVEDGVMGFYGRTI